MTPGRSVIRDLLKRYFRLIEVPPSFDLLVRGSARDVVVITQSDSVVLEALLRSFAERRGVEGVTKLDRVLPDKAPLTSDTLYWESLHNETAIERIREAFPAASLNTLNIFQGRGPIRNNPRYKMGLLRQIGMLAAPLMKKHFFVILFGEPFPVQSPAAPQKTKLVRRVKLDFFQNMKLVRGVPFQPLDVQERHLLAGHEYERVVATLSKKLDISEARVRRRMRREFYRMAAAPRGPLLSCAALLARVLINRLFTDVRTNGVEKFTQAAREHPVILVPMHRSHLDYILLSWMLYESNLNAPLVAAGANLCFWPAGGFARSAGAYFIKRGTQDHVHNFLLQRYVTYLVKRGHLQEFFIEGGRSRSGRMMAPKLGLLGIMVGAFLKRVRKEILFVPVSISYESVIEDKAYGDENTGQPKREESLLELLKVRKIFAKKYGDVIINFGDPISLAQFNQDLCREENGEAYKRKVVVGLANVITARLTEQISPTLSSLIYTALLMAPNYGLRKEALVATVQNLARSASLLKELNPQLGAFSPSLARFLEGRERMLYAISRGGVIEVQDAFGSEVFYIPGGKRFVADFYKNYSLHLFFGMSLLSILDLLGESVDPAGAEALQRLLGQRFMITRGNSFAAEAQDLIELLLREGILERADGKTRFAERTPGIYFPALLLGAVESLAWLYFNLMNSTGQAINDPLAPPGVLASFRQSEFLRKAQSDFTPADRLGLVQRTESASKSALILALEASKYNNIIGMDAVGQSRLIHLYRKPEAELQRLCRIGAAIESWLYGQRPQLHAFR